MNFKLRTSSLCGVLLLFLPLAPRASENQREIPDGIAEKTTSRTKDISDLANQALPISAFKEDRPGQSCATKILKSGFPVIGEVCKKSFQNCLKERQSPQFKKAERATAEALYRSFGGGKEISTNEKIEIAEKSKDRNEESSSKTSQHKGKMPSGSKNSRTGSSMVVSQKVPSDVPPPSHGKER
jgi:hypothetical protein